MKLFNLFSSLLSFRINKIEYGKTYTHLIKNINGFDNLPETTVANIYKDGRPFAHFIEPWLASNYPLIHIKGCKSYDHVDMTNGNKNSITNANKYDQKTFTQHGCNFAPSYMVGKSRTFNKKICEEKANELIYIIVSNIYFPEIKVKFVKGSDLIAEYPKAFIPRRDYDKFFI